MFTSALTASARVGDYFSFQLVADSNAIRYQASRLPVGLSLFPATGIISGIPMTAGTFAVSLAAFNSTGGVEGQMVISVPLPLPLLAELLR
jgi:hypothetical protein